MDKIKANLRADITTLGVVANLAAITKGDDWQAQANEYIDGNHDFVVKFIAQNIPQIKVAKAQGTYLTWLDVTAVANKIDAKRLAAEANRTKAAGAADLTPEQMVERYFVKTAKVHMNNGSGYGIVGANHMRMNIGTSRKLVELALNNLGNALKAGGTSVA
jgi:cystathionine beta-lyase